MSAFVDLKSTAGILLREHDNLEQALAYTERKAAALKEAT